MDALWIMLKNVLIFVGLALPGYILVKAKFIKTGESAVLSKILSYVGMPFLILSSVLNIEFTASFIKIALITAFAFIFLTVLIFFFSRVLTAKESDEKKRGVMRFAMTFANNGFLGIPLAMAVFNNTVVVSLVVFINIFNNILIYTLGLYLVSNDKKVISFKKAFFNPVVIVFILGIILNLVGINKTVPEVLVFSDYLKNIVTPLSMIILGVKLADLPIKELFTSTVSYYLSFIKLIVIPVVAVAFGFAVKYAFNLPIDLLYAFFIAFAMPTATLGTTFADQYNGDTKTSAICTLGSTCLSVLTIPLLYYILNLIITQI